MRKLVLAVAAIAFAGIGTIASSDKAEAFGWCGASYFARRHAAVPRTTARESTTAEGSTAVPP